VNSVFCTDFTADAALDFLLCQAVFINFSARKPARIDGSRQRIGCACGNAVAAEGAFSFAEINAWVAGFVFDDDPSRAGADAVTATRTSIYKIIFHERPRRAQGPFAGGKFTAQKITPAA
jgi:hypothetical protein